MLLLILVEQTARQTQDNSNTSYVAINHIKRIGIMPNTYNSNTSYVAINVGLPRARTVTKRIQIHRMLLLIFLGFLSAQFGR